MSSPAPPTPRPTPEDFSLPPDQDQSTESELDYLTRATFLVVNNTTPPSWLYAHISPSFRSNIDNLGAGISWDAHVAQLARISARTQRTSRITHLACEVDEARARAEVYCHMESAELAAGIRRQGMAVLQWKRHPQSGRWMLLRIVGMREPPAELSGEAATVLRRPSDDAAGEEDVE